MEEYVKLFTSLHDLRRESDDIATAPSFDIIEEKSQFLINIISNITNKPDNEIISFIQRYHTSFLNSQLLIESDVSRESIQGLFTNAKFLNIFFGQIGKLQLDQYEIAFLNRITYDYWTSRDKDQEVCNLLLQISGYINHILTIRLSSKIPPNDAKLLAIIANSTTSDEIKVHRVNRFLVNYHEPRLSVQSMIDIMLFLYDNFLYPIIYTLVEAENCCASEEVIPQYHKLMKAIITILLSMPSDKIQKVLLEYGYKVNHGSIIPAIRLKDIKDQRLQEIIKIVEQDPLITEIP